MNELEKTTQILRNQAALLRALLRLGKTGTVNDPDGEIERCLRKTDEALLSA